MNPLLKAGFISTMCVLAPCAYAQAPHENPAQVSVLNTFASNVLAAHRLRAKTPSVHATSRPGGYANHPHFFTETSHIESQTGKLLSRIRWLRAQPDAAQMMELFFYDAKGRIAVDYYVAYMVDARNAPFSAWVTVHHYGDTLTSLRQFDTDNDVTFERCRGTYNGQPIDIDLDFLEIPPPPERLSKAAYEACFSALPKDNSDYIDARCLLTMPR